MCFKNRVTLNSKLFALQNVQLQTGLPAQGLFTQFIYLFLVTKIHITISNLPFCGVQSYHTKCTALVTSTATVKPAEIINLA